ncbi:MAG: hypothetical protein F7B61_01700 [Caldisphaeraceae archaeon]|nr:hypothetical protein [Caldisphaeraceae archaeon]
MGSEEERQDVKKRWVAKMVKSAKKNHKICPYLDRRTNQCFLMLTMKNQQGKCDREGKFDGCPVFLEFLDRVYNSYHEKGKNPPSDFHDVVNTVV